MNTTNTNSNGSAGPDYSESTLSPVAQASINQGSIDAANRGNANTAGNVPPPTVPSTLNSSNIAPQASSPILTPTPPTPNYNAVTTSIPTIASITDAGNTDTPEATALKASQARLESLMGAENNKAQYQQTAEDNAGVTNLNNQLTDLNTQITTLKNQATAIPIQDQQNANGKGITAGGLAPITSAETRTNAIQALTLNSLASTLQGNLTVAKAAADKVVALKYGPIENEIKVAQQQITDNMPFFTAAQQKQAQATTAQLAERSRLIDQQKADTSTILSWASEAVKNGATNLQAQAIANAPDLNKAFALFSPYASNPQATQKAILDLQQERANIAKTNSDIAVNNSKITSDNQNAVAGWVTNIKAGTAKLSDVPANLKNAVSTGLSTSGTTAPSTILQTTKDSLAELQKLVDTDNGFTQAIGQSRSKSLPGFGILKKTPDGVFAGSKAADFMAKLTQVKNDVVLPNLTLLHGLGRVTDREFQALSSAITSLSPNTTPNAFKTELKTITDRINAVSTTDTSSDTVNVIAPDGTEGTIPKDQLQGALKAGYKQK